jgi:hypothetical protein
MIKDIRLPNGSTERVFIKGAKDGYLYAMDALTGESHWWIDSLKDTERWGYFSRDNGELFDPKSFEDMTRPWLSYGDPRAAGRPWAGPSPTPQFPTAENGVGLVPGFYNGHFATDLAFHDNVIFHYGGSIDQEITAFRDASLRTSGGAWSIANLPFQKTSIIARDAGTGSEIWHVEYPNMLTRGSMLITGGMVIAPFPDGILRFHDELTGTLVNEINLGATLATGVTTGQTIGGEQMIYTVAGQGTIMGAFYGPATPGTVIAVGLGDVPSGQQTVTRTQSQTITQTQTSTSVTTATVTSTSTSVSRTTATSTSVSTSVSVSTSTTTSMTTSVRSSVSTSVATTTTTSTTTEEVGLSSTITYAAIAVAVIAVIAAAVLYTRKT